MNRLVPFFLILVLEVALVGFAAAQDFVSPRFDPLYPQFAHPQQDAAAAIKRRDYRFVTLDRYAKVVPGVERYPRLKEIYHTKFVRQSTRMLFPSRSRVFSFNLRARAYAEEYNKAMLDFLLVERRKNQHESGTDR